MMIDPVHVDVYKWHLIQKNNSIMTPINDHANSRNKCGRPTCSWLQSMSSFEVMTAWSGGRTKNPSPPTPPPPAINAYCLLSLLSDSSNCMASIHRRCFHCYFGITRSSNRCRPIKSIRTALQRSKWNHFSRLSITISSENCSLRHTRSILSRHCSITFDFVNSFFCCGAIYILRNQILTPQHFAPPWWHTK